MLLATLIIILKAAKRVCLKALMIGLMALLYKLLLTPPTSCPSKKTQKNPKKCIKTALFAFLRLRLLAI